MQEMWSSAMTKCLLLVCSLCFLGGSHGQAFPRSSNASACDQNPCRNGGTCQDSEENAITLFTCKCPPFSSGLRCQQKWFSKAKQDGIQAALNRLSSRVSRLEVQQAAAVPQAIQQRLSRYIGDVERQIQGLIARQIQVLLGQTLGQPTLPTTEFNSTDWDWNFFTPRPRIPLRTVTPKWPTPTTKPWWGDIFQTGSHTPFWTPTPWWKQPTTNPWRRNTPTPWWQRPTTRPWWQRPTANPWRRNTPTPWWQRPTANPWRRNTPTPWWQRPTTRPWWQRPTTNPWRRNTVTPRTRFPSRTVSPQPATAAWWWRTSNRTPTTATPTSTPWWRRYAYLNRTPTTATPTSTPWWWRNSNRTPTTATPTSTPWWRRYLNRTPTAATPTTAPWWRRFFDQTPAAPLGGFPTFPTEFRTPRAGLFNTIAYPTLRPWIRRRPVSPGMRGCQKDTQGGLVRTEGPYRFQRGNGIAFNAFCNMTDGGGWTVFQRRKDSSVSFNRNWADYKNGFGDPSENFWFGLENMYQMMGSSVYEMRIDMVGTNGRHHVVKFAEFWLDPENRSYSMRFNGMSSSTLLDSFSVHHSGSPFSTPDRDNDGSRDRHCGRRYTSGWWFNNCLNVNLNGQYRSAGTFAGIIWSQARGTTRYFFQSTEMKMRRKRGTP